MRHDASRLAMMAFALGVLTASLSCGGPRGTGPGTDGGPGTGIDGGGGPVSTALLDGREALTRCDFTSARDAYDAAYRESPDSGEAALGFALMDITFLGEDPEAVAGLRLFGFTSGIDGEALLWGPSGLLDQARRHADGYDFRDRIEAIFPYEPVRTHGSALDLIDPSAMASDVVGHVWAMEARFRRLVDAYVTAAEHAPVAITFGGICELGRVELQAPELYAQATAFQGLVLALEISRAYSWDFRVVDALDWRDHDLARYEEQAAILNTHLGALADPSVLPSVQDEMARFAELLDLTVRSVHDTFAPSSDALVEWRALPLDLQPSAAEDATAFTELVMRPTQAPDLTPVFEGDLAPLFRGELSLDDFGRTFVVMNDPMWDDVWLELDEAPVDGILAAVLTPWPLEDTFDTDTIEWTHRDAWQGDDTEWQMVEIDNPHAYPFDVPRLVSPAAERYVDVLYLE